MKRFSPFLIPALCIAPPALAETGDSALREAMTTLPAYIFTSSELDLGFFLDVAVQRTRGPDEAKNLSILGPVSELQALSTLFNAAAHNNVAEWSQKAGVEPAGIRYFAGFGVPPMGVTIWGFTDEAGASATFDGLSARGFTVLDGMENTLANGDPMGMDLTRRDITDPWIGSMGRTSVVTRQGAQFLHAATPEAYAPILDGAPSLLDSPTGQTLLAALEGQPAPVVQTVFFSPALGLHVADPLPILEAGSHAEAQAALDARQAELSDGVPLYSGAVLAELDDAGKTIGLIALAYPDCATAEAAAQKSASLWPQMGGDMAEATITPGHTDAGAAGCAATLTITTPDGNARSFLAPIDGVFTRNFPPIRIGQ
ncbi:MAG: hypothetical protein Q4G26_13495 [Paracoccus sp. (in: a-proteobacteria)]|nr:hypothetical protein [Paracoccus sp. (in: a-proteobacteria)]